MSPHILIFSYPLIVFCAREDIEIWGCKGLSMKRYLKVIFYAIAALLLGLFVFQIAEFQNFKRKTETFAVSKAAETTAAFKAEIEDLLSRVETEGKALGAEFGAKDFTVDEIKSLIRETSLEFKEIRGVTACFEPYGFSEDKKLILAANGEIYNHKQLAANLDSPYPFKTRSDCEVILPLFQQKGIDYFVVCY